MSCMCGDYLCPSCGSPRNIDRDKVMTYLESQLKNLNTKFTFVNVETLADEYDKPTYLGNFIPEELAEELTLLAEENETLWATLCELAYKEQ